MSKMNYERPKLGPGGSGRLRLVSQFAVDETDAFFELKKRKV